MPKLLIELDESEWEPLKRAAAQLNCTEAEFARRMLRQTLQHITHPTAEWQQQLDALLSRVQQQTMHHPPEEVEADITAAYEEYRRECEP